MRDQVDMGVTVGSAIATGKWSAPLTQRALGCALCLAIVAGCSGPTARDQQPAASAAPSPARVIPGASLTSSVPAPAETPGQWIRPAGDLSSTRYSDLGEITAERVGSLTVKASFATGN